MTVTILVHGGSLRAREEAIAARLDPHARTAVITEGIPESSSPLDTALPKAQLEIIRIAPGCPCCTGNLTLRVMLNRILRKPPQALYLSLADTSHLVQIRSFLQDPQYQRLLHLAADLHCPA